MSSARKEDEEIRSTVNREFCSIRVRTYDVGLACTGALIDACVIILEGFV